MSEREYLRWARGYKLAGYPDKAAHYLNLAKKARRDAELAEQSRVANAPPINLVKQPDGSFAPADPKNGSNER